MPGEIKREVGRFLIALAGIVVVLFVLLFIMFVSPWVFDGASSLFTGWVYFPLRVASEVTVDWGSVSTAGVLFVLFICGVHCCARWLYDSDPSLDGKRHWRVGSTLRIVALIVFSFVAGMSTVGIVHQITWLATTEETLLESDPLFQQFSPRDSAPE